MQTRVFHHVSVLRGAAGQVTDMTAAKQAHEAQSLLSMLSAQGIAMGCSSHPKLGMPCVFGREVHEVARMSIAQASWYEQRGSPLSSQARACHAA